MCAHTALTGGFVPPSLFIASAALGSVPAVSLVSSSARVLGHDQGHNMASHVEAAASDRDIEVRSKHHKC